MVLIHFLVDSTSSNTRHRDKSIDCSYSQRQLDQIEDENTNTAFTDGHVDHVYFLQFFFSTHQVLPTEFSEIQKSPTKFI